MDTRDTDPRAQMYRLIRHGRIAEAERLAREVKATAEAAGDALLAAEAAHRLGEAFHEGFRYEEAWRAFEEALTARSAALGPDHLLTTYTRACLAAVAWSLDRGVEARALARRAAAALPSGEPARDEDRNAAAEALKALALIERKERAEEARSMARRALTLVEKAATPDELEIASACVCLGVAEQNAGRRAAARRHFERALEIRRRVLGEEHAYVAFCMDHLAGLTMPDDIEGARALVTRSVAMIERCLGPDHPSLSTALLTLGTTWVMEEKAENAFPLFDRAIAIEEAFFGPAHPHLSGTLSVVAMVRSGLGDVKVSEPIWRRIVELCKPFPETRRDTLVSAINNLILALRAQERLQDILAFAEPLIDRWELDPTIAPEILTALWNGAAEVHYRLKRTAKAEKLLKRALATAERRFGQDAAVLDPLLANLAQLYTSMGRRSEAAALERRRQSLEVAPS